MAFKIDKGILGSFLLLLGVVGLIGGLFFAQYIYAIILGTIFDVVGDVDSTNTKTNQTFIADNTTAVRLPDGNLTAGTLTIFNDTAVETVFGLGNFTIDLVQGTILLIYENQSSPENGTPLAANYTYTQTVHGGIDVTAATQTFLSNTEADFFTTSGYVNNGAKFAGTLITVAVILIIFGAFLTMGGRRGKKDDDDMDY